MLLEGGFDAGQVLLAELEELHLQDGPCPAERPPGVEFHCVVTVETGSSCGMVFSFQEKASRGDLSVVGAWGMFVLGDCGVS